MLDLVGANLHRLGHFDGELLVLVLGVSFAVLHELYRERESENPCHDGMEQNLAPLRLHVLARVALPAFGVERLFLGNAQKRRFVLLVFRAGGYTAVYLRLGYFPLLEDLDLRERFGRDRGCGIVDVVGHSLLLARSVLQHLSTVRNIGVEKDGWVRGRGARCETGSVRNGSKLHPTSYCRFARNGRLWQEKRVFRRVGGTRATEWAAAAGSLCVFPDQSFDR